MDEIRGINSVPIVDARVDKLLQHIIHNLARGQFVSYDQLMRAYTDAANMLSRGSRKRLFDIPKIIPGSHFEPPIFSRILISMFIETTTAMDILRRTGGVCEENFNYAVAMVRNLQSRIKKLSQDLSVYTLYSNNLDASFMFGETFTNEKHIDRGSSFLSLKENFVNLTEGTISLPLKEDISREIKQIGLGSESNCIIGNNVQANVASHSRLKDMFDNNPDTWTEFEKVVYYEDEVGLILELKMVLNKSEPINGLYIQPVLLGSRTAPSILNIEISEDGRVWHSLKEDISVADFLDESIEDRFHLSPYTSKFEGAVNISFAPRFAQFLRLKFHQSSAFPIQDVYGNYRLRYALGFKEIKIKANKYESSGELISKPIVFGSNLSAVGLQSLIDPVLLPREVGGCDYFMSFNNGASWEQISSIEESRLDIPEILFPPENSSELRYKVKLFKDENAFQESISTEEFPFSEIHSWPVLNPSDIELKHLPISGSLSVFDSEIVSRGWIYPKTVIGKGVLSSLIWDTNLSGYKRLHNTKYKLEIPLNTIIDPASIEVWVSGNKSTPISSFAAYDEDSLVHMISRTDDKKWELTFGNGSATDPKGFIPSPSDEISITLTEENIVPEGIEAPYKINLDYPADSNKSRIEIRFVRPAEIVPMEVIPPGRTQYQTKFYPIHLINDIPALSITVRNTAGTIYEQSWHGAAPGPDLPYKVFQTHKTFINGDVELVDPGDWTFDYQTGIIYTKTPTRSQYITSVSYFGKNDIILKNEDWDFVKGSMQEIDIKDSGYYTSIYNDEITGLLPEQLSCNLDKQGIVSKSLRLASDFFGSYQPFEVGFIDGIEEFGLRGTPQDEPITAGTATEVVTGKFIIKHRLTHWQSLLASVGVSVRSDLIANQMFPSDQEKTFVDGVTELTTNGDWSVDYSGTGSDGKGYIYLFQSTLWSVDFADLKFSYQFVDAAMQEDIKGGYSVDVKNGIVYFAVPPSVTSSIITYKYTEYKIKYIVSSLLEENNDYTVSGKVVTLLKGSYKRSEKKIGFGYKYTTEESRNADLAPYFSPLLRAIKIKAN